MKRMRLENYDYSSEGMYFVTFNVKDRMKLFGKIFNEELILTDIGKIAYDIWANIPDHYTNVEIDEFIIMPDHIHGIIVINEKVKAEQCLTNTQKQPINYGLLSKIINSYKNVVTKTIRKKYPDINFQWQKTFYDHIIRKYEDLERIQKYIKYNYLKIYMEANIF